MKEKNRKECERSVFVFANIREEEREREREKRNAEIGLEECRNSAIINDPGRELG